MKIDIWKYTVSIHKRRLTPAHGDSYTIPAPSDATFEVSNPLHEKSIIPISPAYEKRHNTWKEKLGIIAEEAFQVFLVTYLFLLLVETIKPDFVSYFFNLNILLGVVMVAGIIMTLFAPEKPQIATLPAPIHWKYIATVTIAAALLVYYKTEDLRGLSIVLTVLTGGIIFLLSYVISVDSNELT